MRVLVNAVSIREGGPRVVLMKLLPRLASRPDVEFAVAAPPDICAELRDSVQKVLPIELDASPLALLRWYERGLASAAQAYAADVVFSVTNYLPLSALPAPALLLVQHAGHFSPVFDGLMHGPDVSWRERIAWRAKRSWVRRSVRRARMVTVQTRTLADTIVSDTGIAQESIKVIPHGPGWVDRCATAREPRRSGPLRIGYVSKFGVQKNFGVLFRAAKVLMDEGLNIRLVLTLDAGDPQSRAVLAQAHALGLSGTLENHGEVRIDKLNDLYDGLDLFVFPSLCESFGMPMLEAMARGLCVIVADTPENREMVGEAGVTFPPHDADALAAIVRRLNGDDVERAARGRLSLQRAAEFSWDAAAESTLQALRAVSAHG